MFTGLIESVGEIADVTAIEGGFRIGIRTDLSSELREGESVAVNGVCLTVVRAQAARLGRRDRSRDGEGHEPWSAEARVARQPRAGDARRMDGLAATLCSGHVDGTGAIQAIRPEADFSWVTVSYPGGLAPLLIHRGSVAVDGISLTVAKLEAKTFDVQIVPFTWTHTNLRAARVGDRVNLECDMVGKYVLRAVEQSTDVLRFGQTVTRRRTVEKIMTAPLKIAKGRKKSGSPFARIEDAIEAFRAGEMIIVCDDEDRENEGDLTMAAEKVTPKAINFMAKYGRGLICMPMTAERLDELEIPLMVNQNTARFGTAFCVSIEAQAFDEHGHLGRRSRQHGARGDRPSDEAARSGAARPHVSAARAVGRRAGARGADRGGRRPGAHCRAVSGRRHLRNHERRRLDGARAGADEVREAAPAADDHDRRPDQVPYAQRVDW